MSTKKEKKDKKNSPFLKKSEKKPIKKYIIKGIKKQ